MVLGRVAVQSCSSIAGDGAAEAGVAAVAGGPVRVRADRAGDRAHAFGISLAGFSSGVPVEVQMSITSMQDTPIRQVIINDADRSCEWPPQRRGPLLTLFQTSGKPEVTNRELHNAIPADPRRALDEGKLRVRKLGTPALGLVTVPACGIPAHHVSADAGVVAVGGGPVRVRAGRECDGAYVPKILVGSGLRVKARVEDQIRTIVNVYVTPSRFARGPLVFHLLSGTQTQHRGRLLTRRCVLDVFPAILIRTGPRTDFLEHLRRVHKRTTKQEQYSNDMNHIFGINKIGLNTRL